jgi:hypothetical protein
MIVYNNDKTKRQPSIFHKWLWWLTHQRTMIHINVATNYVHTGENLELCFWLLLLPRSKMLGRKELQRINGMCSRLFATRINRNWKNSDKAIQRGIKQEHAQKRKRWNKQSDSSGIRTEQPATVYFVQLTDNSHDRLSHHQHFNEKRHAKLQRP